MNAKEKAEEYAMKCKKCKHWKSEQSELDYSTFYGICTNNNWEFKTSDNADIKVLDRENRSDLRMGVHTFENQKTEIPIGMPNKSRYCFVTEENFGCIYFDKR